MKAKFYYNGEDALKAAQDFAKEHNGTIANNLTTMDDRCDFDYMDNRANNLMWSGEVGAYHVQYDGGDAYFAYWD